VSISIVCNFTLLLLLLVTNSTKPEIYFGRFNHRYGFNPLDHATNMMIIDWLLLRPKSPFTHYIVDDIVSSPFCSAVRMYSDDYYYTL